MNQLPVLLIHSNPLIREALTFYLSATFPHRLAIATLESVTLSGLNGLVPRVILVDATRGDSPTQRSVTGLISSFPSSQIVLLRGPLLHEACSRDPVPRACLPTLQTIGSLQELQILLASFLDTNGTEQAFSVLKGSSGISIRKWLRQDGEWILNADRLTTREREMVLLVRDGYCDKEIAQKLNLSTQRIKNQLHIISRKIFPRPQ